jgi:hypothetical protein
VQIHHLRRRANLDWTQVQRVVHLVLGFNLALLAVVFYLSENRIGRLFVLGPEQVLEGLRCLVNFLIRPFGCWSKVVYTILSTLHIYKPTKTSVD